MHEVAEFEDVIISLGGGRPCFFDNMEYINQQAETIYLKGTPEILYEHLMMAKGKRPLLEGKSPEELKEYIKTSLESREPFYCQAKHIFNIELLGNGDKINKCVEDICTMLNIP